MVDNYFFILYLIMLFLQTVHIFEEIGFKAYEVVGSLNKYLFVASFLVFASYLPLVLILLISELDISLRFSAQFLPWAMALFTSLGTLKPNHSEVLLAPVYSAESLWGS